MESPEPPPDQQLTYRERKALLFFTACFAVGCLSLAIRTYWKGEPVKNIPSVTGNKLLPGTRAESRPGSLYQGSLTVDLNKATADQFQRLPGIGPSLSRRIVINRKEHGAFSNVDDLSRVKGIGPKTVEKIRDLIRVDSPAHRDKSPG